MSATDGPSSGPPPVRRMGKVTVGREDLCRVAVVWSSIAQSRLERLAVSLGHLQAFEAEANFYQQWEEAGRPAEWQSHVDEIGRPGIYGDWWMMTAEYHFALLSLAHVVKAVDALKDTSVPQFEKSELLRLLRNYQEHWEDPDGTSGSELKADRPGFAEEPIQFTKEWLVFQGISDDELLDWLRAVGISTREILQREGGEFPSWGDALWPSSRDATWLPERMPGEGE